MKHNVNILLSGVSCLFLALQVSCSQQSWLERFPLAPSLKYEIVKLQADSYLSRTFGLYGDNNTLIAWDVDDKYYFSLIDLKKGQIVAKFARRGVGPGEIPSNPRTVTTLPNQRFCFFVGKTKSMFEVEYSNPDSIKLSKRLSFLKNTQIISCIPIAERYYVALGLFADGRYLLLDKEGNKIDCFLDYPKFDTVLLFKEFYGNQR
jgi:hypothetical protein